MSKTTIVTETFDESGKLVKRITETLDNASEYIFTLPSAQFYYAADDKSLARC